MYTLSQHAQSRQKRLFAIVDTIGIGNEVDKFFDAQRQRYEVFTDTGVLLIVTEDNVLVTAYAVNQRKAYAKYRDAGRSEISPRVLQGIYYHEEHYEFLDRM